MKSRGTHEDAKELIKKFWPHSKDSRSDKLEILEEALDTAWDEGWKKYKEFAVEEAIFYKRRETKVKKIEIT